LKTTPTTMSNTPTPTELPEDIKKEIALESEDYANKRYKYRLYPNEWMAAYNAHHAGATAYAPHKVEAERAKKLLEKVLAEDETGFFDLSKELFNEINQFLQSNK
jgi:hypothetical protein